MVLITVLTVIVMIGVTYRFFGAALVWYDEVASILMAWLTYYGAALAAVKRAHIGFPGFVASLSPTYQRATLIVAEALVFGFFVLLAWVGWQVFEVLEGDRLVSLPDVPLQIAQSVIPIGAVLFIIAEALSLPEAWRKAGQPGAVAAHAPITREEIAKEVLSTE
jgi:TRAP-type C4-dicarboxylate transport system permease small subunit